MASAEPFDNGSAEYLKPESYPAPSEAPSVTVKTESGETPATATAPSEQLATLGTAAEKSKWPGWPGECVFRLLVPVLKVGSIIGRKGEFIKRICEETRTRVRILDAPVGTPDRIVLISGKEEIEATLSPAMVAVIRVFKRVTELPETEDYDGEASGASWSAFCSIRLLVASAQATSLIGKQGSVIKSMQENSGCSIRVLSTDEVSTLLVSSEERVVELHGEALKVLKGLEAVVGHLRKFLVDRSVLPLFEKSQTSVAQEHHAESWADKTLPITGSVRSIGGSEYPVSVKRETLFLERDPQREMHVSSSGLSLYGRDSGLSSIRSPVIGRAGGPIVTQVAQTMQIPLDYAEDIIGVGGTNIAYIRRTSGAILTVQESRGLPDEITVEIKGTTSQVQAAQQLIEECVSGHREAYPGRYNSTESGLRSSYSRLGDTSYFPSSSFSGHSYGGYGSSGLGGYSYGL